MNDLTEIRQAQFEAWIKERYGDQNFDVWDAYLEWLLVALTELNKH